VADDDPHWAYAEQTDDEDRYAADVAGRRLIIAFPRLHGDVDRGTATWRAYWEGEPDRSFTGEVSFKHHITAHDVEGVVRWAVGMAPGALA
jgi:hypothetical protein